MWHAMRHRQACPKNRKRSRLLSPPSIRSVSACTLVCCFLLSSVCSPAQVHSRGKRHSTLRALLLRVELCRRRAAAQLPGRSCPTRRPTHRVSNSLVRRPLTSWSTARGSCEASSVWACSAVLPACCIAPAAAADWRCNSAAQRSSSAFRSLPALWAFPVHCAGERQPLAALCLSQRALARHRCTGLLRA